MRGHIAKSASFLKATAIGGAFFLLPLFVVALMLGKVLAIVQATAEPLHRWIPVNSSIGVALLFCLAIALLILLCFLAGMIASRAIGKKFSTTLEKQLITVFPKYAIYKDLLAGNLKGHHDGPSLQTVLVSTPLGFRLAFEVDRLPSGLVVIYMPGAPDAWIGSVVLIPEAQVSPTSISFNDAVGIQERLGRDSLDLLAGLSLGQSTHSHESPGQAKR